MAFEPMFTTKSGRLGLGLNVVRRIALRAQGTVELERRPEGGVVAALTLRSATAGPG
jgi:C4-dicarboxylate-specific signal transduction histidine kinase